MPFTNVVSFICAIAGSYFVIAWCIRGYRVYKGNRVLIGHFPTKDGLSFFKFTLPLKLLPKRILCGGIALLIIAMSLVSLPR